MSRFRAPHGARLPLALSVAAEVHYTGRFTKLARLAELLGVPPRCPLQPWRPPGLSAEVVQALAVDVAGGAHSRSDFGCSRYFFPGVAEAVARTTPPEPVMPTVLRLFELADADGPGSATLWRQAGERRPGWTDGRAVFQWVRPEARTGGGGVYAG